MNKYRGRFKIAVLAYHKIDSRFEFGVTRNTLRQFQRHLELFERMNLQVCSLGDYLLEGRNDKVTLTFDDAYESVYENAYPIFIERNLPFTVFPVVKYIGEFNDWEVNLGGKRFKHMDWGQLKEMKGVEIGSHTMTHRSLLTLSRGELLYELDDSRKILQDKLGVSVDYLSVPFGRYSEQVLSVAREVGYKAVCVMNPSVGVDDFAVGRYGVYYIDNIRTMRRKLGHGWLNKFEQIKLRVVNRFSYGTIIVKQFTQQ